MNVLNRINLILAAMGSKPYTIKELSLEDVLHAGNYSIGIKCLIKNLRKSIELKEPTFMNLLVDVHDISSGLLYRASSDKGINPFLFTPGERIAEGSSNIYTRLISGVLPSWRNFPKRNKSVICTNSFFVAADYVDYSVREKGVVYVVIPPNDAKLVVSPTKDIWIAFKDLESLDYVEDCIATFLAFFYHMMKENLIDITANPPKIIKPSKMKSELLKSDEKKLIYIDTIKEMFIKQDQSSILNYFSEVDKILSNRKIINTFITIYEDYADDGVLFNFGKYIFKQKMSNNNITILEILDDLFNPDNNDFELTNYSSFARKYYTTREVWTEDPCIFIDFENRKFLTELYEKYTDANKKEIQHE